MSMRRIIYVDGALADAIGRQGLQVVADLVSKLSGEPVDFLTHGESKYHATHRIIGNVPASKALEA